MAEYPETSLAEESADTRESPEDDLISEDILVEEISIDGMCGVY
ncbi:MAG TPA: mycofactocin precursor MftA [Acidimicrobiales bacterium]